VGLFLVIQPFTFAQWTPTNGPYGGILSTFLADGLNLFTTTNSEVYLSADSGSNWVSISNGLPDFLYRITAFAVQDNFMFIGVNYNFGELYRTGSAGINWEILDPGLPPYAFISDMDVFAGNLFLATTKGVFRSDDMGGTVTAYHPGMNDTIVTALYRNGNRLYAGTYHGSLYYLENLEAGWVNIPAGSLPEDCYIRSIWFQDPVLYIGTSYGVYQTPDEGITWVTSNNGLTDTTVVALTGDTDFLYAGTPGAGVFRSQDSGGQWEPVNSGLGFMPLSVLGQANDRLYAGVFGGMYRSEDQGASWNECNNGLAPLSATSLLELDNRLFAGSYLGVFRSDDYGEHWIRKGEGLTHRVVRCLAAKDSILFAGTESGICVSYDLGESWIPASNGLDEGATLTIGRDGSLMFAGTHEGLYRTNNNGIYWTPLWEDETVYAFAKVGEYLFASTYNGIRRSADHGNTWTEANNGLTNVWALALEARDSLLYSGAEYVFKTPADPVLWLPTGDGTGQAPHWPDDILATDSTLFVANTSCIWVSPNGGDEWFDVGAGLVDYHFMRELCIFDGDLYAATRVGVWKRPLTEMYSLSLHPDTLMLDFKVNSTGSLYVRTNADWHLEGEIPSWLEIDKLNGSGTDTLLVRAVEQNPDTLTRADSFTMMSSCAEPQCFTVVQIAFEGSLSANPDTMKLSYLPDSHDTLFIDANVAWWLIGDFPEWLSADHISGSGNDSIVFHSIQENTQEFSRTASFALESDFTPPSGIFIVQLGTPAGLPDEKISNLLVSPNPTSGRLTIRSEHQIIEVRVYDIFGRITNRLTGAGEKMLTITLGEKGVYFLEVLTELSNSLIKVIVY